MSQMLVSAIVRRKWLSFIVFISQEGPKCFSDNSLRVAQFIVVDRDPELWLELGLEL